MTSTESTDAMPEYAASDHGVSERLDFSVNVDTSARVVSVSGELDIATAPILLSAINSILETLPGDLTLDFAQLSFIDSAGLGALVSIRVAQDEQHAELWLRNLSARHRRVMMAGGLASMLS